MEPQNLQPQRAHILNRLSSDIEVKNDPCESESLGEDMDQEGLMLGTSAQPNITTCTGYSKAGWGSQLVLKFEQK